MPSLVTSSHLRWPLERPSVSSRESTHVSTAVSTQSALICHLVAARARRVRPALRPDPSGYVQPDGHEVLA